MAASSGCSRAGTAVEQDAGRRAPPAREEGPQACAEGPVAAGRPSHPGANRYVLTSAHHPQAAATPVPDAAADPAQTYQFGPGTDFETSDDFFLPPWKTWSGPYEAMLGFLAEGGWLEGLPADAHRALHVSVPFCSALMECQALSAFLAETLLTKPGISRVAILGTDWIANDSYCWERKERYVAKKYPRMSLQLRQMDLTQAPLPPCALSLGIHPEANAGNDAWRHILANVVRSARGGVCAFATFFEGEVQAVLKACRPLGVDLQVHENPYYRSHPVGSPPFLRFILVGPVAQELPEPPLPAAGGDLQEDAAAEPHVEYVDLYIEVPVIKHRIVPVVTVTKKYVEVPVPATTERGGTDHQPGLEMVRDTAQTEDVPQFQVIRRAGRPAELPHAAATGHSSGQAGAPRTQAAETTVGASGQGAGEGSEDGNAPSGKQRVEVGGADAHRRARPALPARMRSSVCLPLRACFPACAR